MAFSAWNDDRIQRRWFTNNSNFKPSSFERGYDRPSRRRRQEDSPFVERRGKFRETVGANPPTVEKGDGKAITVAKGKGGGSYCFGCGAVIVKPAELEEPQTSSSSRRNSAAGGVNVEVGLKSQKSGYWNQKRQELKISKLKNWGLCPRCQTLQKSSAPKSNSNVNDDNYSDSLVEALSPSHEMTQIFRDQVSHIRSKPDAVVILCVDAVDVWGSLIRTLRQYIGGNPILLAATRCDLLPDYVSNNGWSKEKEANLKAYFATVAAELNPADVFCAVWIKEATATTTSSLMGPRN